MTRKRLGCIIAPIAIVVLLAVSMLFLIPQCSHDSITCDSHMRLIWFALREYAEERGGEYPPQLEDLHPQYIDLTRNKCTMCRAGPGSLETGYTYLPGASTASEPGTPLLFCARYHLAGHGAGMYCAQFSVLLNDYTIVHAREHDLCKYDGPMRRYFLFFRRYPYDGSRPTTDLVVSLENLLQESVGRSNRFVYIDDWQEQQDRTSE